MFESDWFVDVEYEVRVVTGGVAMAGTDANVYLIMHGKGGIQSPKNTPEE